MVLGPELTLPLTLTNPSIKLEYKCSLRITNSRSVVQLAKTREEKKR
jgi:hypothetical protein